MDDEATESEENKVTTKVKGGRKVKAKSLMLPTSRSTVTYFLNMKEKTLSILHDIIKERAERLEKKIDAGEVKSCPDFFKYPFTTVILLSGNCPGGEEYVPRNSSVRICTKSRENQGSAEIWQSGNSNISCEKALKTRKSPKILYK